MCFQQAHRSGTTDSYNRTLTFGCIKFYGIFPAQLLCFGSSIFVGSMLRKFILIHVEIVFEEIYFNSCRDSVSLIKYFILD
jgi:hypothetical protein